MKKTNFSDLKRDIRTARYLLKLTHKLSYGYITLMVFTTITQAISPLINIVLSRYIINEIVGERRLNQFLLLCGITIGSNFILNILSRWFNNKLEVANHNLCLKMELHLGKKIMNLQYENLEDPEILNQKERAIFPIRNQNAMWNFYNDLSAVLRSTITLIGVISIIATLNIAIILIIVLITLLNGRILSKTQEKRFQLNNELIPDNRNWGYYLTLVSDYTMAKEVRIYNMSPYLLKKLERYNDKLVGKFVKTFNQLGRYNVLSSFNVQLQTCVIYVYLLWCAYSARIGIGDFTMYVSATNTFTSSFSALLNQMIHCRQMVQYLAEFLNFEQIPIHTEEKTQSVTNLHNITIEFSHVYFKYPRSEDYVLEDINVFIKQGEKISIVGENGAGKTTFIKLLCRLYQPTKGKILMNGIDIMTYKQEEYNKLLTVVFQDFKLFAFSIKENMCFDQKCDEVRLQEAISKSGVADKMKQLSKGVDTSLYKYFDPDGIELSGGENQKLAIARAIYKDTPIIILDEPTAALDPYAEYEIFSNFNQLVNNKTAIFISHRLSSCQFSDRVIVFEHGKIIETGSHEELVKQKRKYQKMWETQAQYYL